MNLPTSTYYSNGKLLLTGEYLVLDGALALGLPTKFGQDLVSELIDEPNIYWKSKDEKGNCWFEQTFSLPLTNKVLSNSVADSLQHILKTTAKLNPNFLTANKGFKITTHLSFPADWGLGTSSTLINNIAQWAKVGAFELLAKTFDGSGYDIACAQNDTPILFQLEQKKPMIKQVDFSPIFKDQLYFVHLNKKQRSNSEITRYKEINKGVNEAIKTVSEITDLVINATNLDDFEMLLTEHEQLLSSVLQIPPVQQLHFKDYFGKVKSLGAWGGDFVLATGNQDTPKYFKKKGFETILLYDEMILKND